MAEIVRELAREAEKVLAAAVLIAATNGPTIVARLGSLVEIRNSGDAAETVENSRAAQLTVLRPTIAPVADQEWLTTLLRSAKDLRFA